MKSAALCLQVWRLSWNVTGTILASSGDDGCVKLWKGINLCSYEHHEFVTEKPWVEH